MAMNVPDLPEPSLKIVQNINKHRKDKFSSSKNITDGKKVEYYGMHCKYIKARSCLFSTIETFSEPNPPIV